MHIVGTHEPWDSYYLMRRLFCTGLGLIYFNAFAIFYFQGPGLYGTEGLLPIQEYIGALQKGQVGFFDLPSVFWWVSSDAMVTAVGLLGLSLSLVLVFGFANFPLLLGLWFLHMSVIHMGQLFYSFGWETQLLELTFLSFFLFPLWNPLLNQRSSPPKKIAIYFQRWMMFRLMLGAGLIKIRGDECWRDLTCTYFHYETQPNPNPLSWTFHHLPEWFHKGEVLMNHGVELLFPFFLFGPKWMRRIGGVVMILFQLSLIVSGNLSWLNWLTILMAVPCFDDEFLNRIIDRFQFGWMKVKTWKYNYLSIRPKKTSFLTLVTLVCFTIAGLFLSYDPAMNLISDRQAMNTSYNKLHLINSYGAFGVVGRHRDEVIIMGTDSENLDDPQLVWREYEFPCKPGDIYRAPCVITPYHYRLDWQIWFSAMRPQMTEVWLLRLSQALLENNEKVLSLLHYNPFPGRPPKFIQMVKFRYEFSKPGEKAWWKRKKIGIYLPPINLQHPLIRQYKTTL